eukprot:scaffold7385_cov533-Prasinococcus_capsulatus_cf.AAC.5
MDFVVQLAPLMRMISGALCYTKHEQNGWGFKDPATLYVSRYPAAHRGHYARLRQCSGSWHGCLNSVAMTNVSHHAIDIARTGLPAF